MYYIVVFIVIVIASFILKYIENDKFMENKKVRVILCIAGIISFIGGFNSTINFFAGVDFALEAKNSVISMYKKDKKSSSVSKSTTQTTIPTKVPTPVPTQVPTSKPTMEVPLSQTHKTDSNVNGDNMTETRKKAIITPLITNIKTIDNKNEKKQLCIEWTPIIDIEEYMLKIEIDDPFYDSALENTFLCTDNHYYLDISEYPNDTIIFISVAVMDFEKLEWKYSNAINFKIK